jgi:hypothetical protein
MNQRVPWTTDFFHRLIEASGMGFGGIRSLCR